MIINRQRRVPVDVKPLGQFLGRVQSALRLSGREVSICLVSDPAMARLNRAFRRKRGPTDVLAFPANGRLRRQAGQKAKRHEAPQLPARDPYLGDIAISAETARRHARRFRRTLPQELRILILHGMLHLLGHDHETDRGEMSRVEQRLRRRLGLG